MNTGLRRRLVERITGAEELDPASDGGEMQTRAESYWRKASDTYYGNPKFYDRRERELDHALTNLPTIREALDIGCGDGRYTLRIAAHAGHVEGRDISPALIASATERARRAGVDNVLFTTAPADAPISRRAFDLVCALGVTSCIVDDEPFAKFIRSSADACRPGGHLLLIDSLSLRGDALNKFNSGYVARYRPLENYRDAVTGAGFTLLNERDLGSPAVNPLVRAWPVKRRTNRLFLFRRD